MNDAANGTRLDLGSHGADLTDVNSNVGVGTSSPFGYEAITASAGPARLQNTTGTIWAHNSPFTIQFWFYLDTGVISNGEDMCHTDDEAGYGSLYEFTTTVTRSIRGQLLTGGSRYAGTLNDTAWNHVMFIYSTVNGWGSTYNGSAIGWDASASPGDPNDTRVAFGGNIFANNGSDYKFAEIAVWNYAFVQDDVAALYAAGAGRVIEV
jgi:hypothetical protein